LPTGAACISTTARLIRSQTDFPSWSPRSAIVSPSGRDDLSIATVFADQQI
jgi:hypothetical protein